MTARLEVGECSPSVSQNTADAQRRKKKRSLLNINIKTPDPKSNKQKPPTLQTDFLPERQMQAQDKDENPSERLEVNAW